MAYMGYIAADGLGYGLHCGGAIYVASLIAFF
jgi:hypothetical protein